MRTIDFTTIEWNGLKVLTQIQKAEIKINKKTRYVKNKI